jgi:hypothetical protein
MKKFLSASQAMAFLSEKADHEETADHEDTAEHTAYCFIHNFKDAFVSMTVSRTGLITVNMKTEQTYDRCVIRFHNTRFQNCAHQAQTLFKSGSTVLRGQLDFEYDWQKTYSLLRACVKN